MEALATLNNQRQFDFQNNGIEVMDLETLQYLQGERHLRQSSESPLADHPAHDGHLLPVTT